MQRQLQVGFLITLVAGGVLIFLGGKFLPGVVNIILTLAVMTAYWAAMSKKYSLSANSKIVFADSFYYLGFLFTFVALLAALMQLQTDGKVWMTTIQIVGQMGSALASTVYGMAVRVYLTQFDAIVSEPTVDVLDGAGRLAASLQASVDHFDLALKKQIRNTEEMADKTAEASYRLRNSMAQIDFSRISMAISDTVSVISKLKSEIEGLQSHVQRQNVALESLERSSIGFDNILEASKKKIEQTRDITANVTRVTSTLEQLNSEIKLASDRSISKMEEAKTAFEAAKSRADQLKKGVDRYLTDFRKSLSRDI